MSQIWRSLYGGRSFGSKPSYPINRVVLSPATTTQSIVLGTLTFSATSFTVGTVTSGTIIGATPLSTITASGLPTGLTINGPLRTWAYDGTGVPGSGSFTLTETLTGATNTPHNSTIGYTISAAAGTLSAPALGYPSSQTLQPTIAFHPGADWQAGDVLKLARSSSPAMSSPLILTHAITDTDITNGTFSIGLAGVTLAGITYFQAYGAHAGADSTNKSGIVAWGDTTAPVVTTAATFSTTEQTQLAITLAATDTGGVPALVSDGTSPGWYISGGADRLQFQVAVVAGVPTLQLYGNGVALYSTPANNPPNAANPYNVQITAVDYSGNQSTPLSEAVTFTQIDSTPNSFTFTTVSNAPLSTLETSNTVTIAGLQAGFNIASSLSGTGFTYSKNGGAYQSPGSFTVANGDTLTLRTTSASANNINEICTVTVGTYSTTWAVSTPSSITAGTGAVSGTFPGSPYSFTSQTLTAGYLTLFLYADYGRPVTSVTCSKTGQSTVTLTQIANPSSAGYVFAGTIPVTASDWTITITDTGTAPVLWAILPVTVATSNTTPAQTDIETWPNGTNSPFLGATTFSIPSGGCAYSFICGVGDATTQFAVTRTDGAATLATFNFVNFDGRKCAIVAHQMQSNGKVAFTTVPVQPNGNTDLAGLEYNA